MKQIEKRKADHIQVALEEDVSSAHDHWDDIRLIHDSLPEIDMNDIDTSATLFGKKLSFPLMITAITGGYSTAEKINRNLAEACQDLQIGLGVGSQRAALESGNIKSYSVIKDYDIPLRIGNIGAPQLIEQRGKRAFGKDDASRAMEMIDADIMAVHLNYLQEVVQPEGDVKAKGCFDAIRSLCRDVPVLVKETGAGISKDVAVRLKGIGIRGLDVSGASGTSFSLVESKRSRKMGDVRCARIGETFGDWGIPAPVSVVWADVGLPVIASGGIMNGLHIAKSIAIGAQCAGMARYILRDAMESSEAVKESLMLMRDELRAAMFLTGSISVKELSKRNVMITGPTREWLGPIKGDE